MPREKWSAPEGWLDMLAAEMERLKWDKTTLAKEMGTTKGTVTKLFNGNGGKSLAFKIGARLPIGPPCVNVETKEEADLFASVKRMKSDPSAVNTLAILARQFADKIDR